LSPGPVNWFKFNRAADRRRPPRQRADRGRPSGLRSTVTEIPQAILVGYDHRTVAGGIAHEVQQCLAQAHLVCLHRSDPGIALNRNFVGVLGRQGFNRLDDICNERRKRERQTMHHPPRTGAKELRPFLGTGTASKTDASFATLRRRTHTVGLPPQTTASSVTAIIQ